MRTRTGLALLVVLLGSIALAACGGGGSGGGGGETAGDLPGLAAQAQTFVTQQVVALASVQTKAELLNRLNDAQDQAHALSNAIEDADTPPELSNARADFGLAMRAVTVDIGRIRGLVAGGDVDEAKKELTNLSSVKALEDAISEIQSAS